MHNPALDRLALERVVQAKVAPAATLGVAVREGPGWRVSVGSAGRTLRGPATPETVFDLASLTKSFVATAFAQLTELGVLENTTPLGRLLEEAGGTSSEHTPLELLLSHRAGLPAHQAFFAPLSQKLPFMRGPALRSAAASALSAPTLSAPQGFPPVYSDLGFLLAGIAMERRLGEPLDLLVRKHVTQPLGISAGSARQWLDARVEFQERVAPTERVPFRGGLVVGVTHDENAWAFSGHGLCGHAGLFGTVSDVLGFGMALLDSLSSRSSEWLQPKTVAALIAERPGSSLRLGFDTKSGPNSSAGTIASDRTFGHLGFTGTSFWCDPVADAVTVLLTNRVSPTRENQAIRVARPAIHDTLLRTARPGSPI